MTHIPTEAEIEALRTPAGGWKRDTLAEWGVPWPPPKGWKRQLLALGKVQRAGRESPSPQRNSLSD